MTAHFMSLYTKKPVLFICLLFLCSCIIRMPHLNRPLAKHHEYNTAMVLINIQSWRAAGGGHHFNYIPVLNFQGKNDKIPALSELPHFDKNGNALYYSFGAGWYLLPYLIYELFQWPAIPLYLQWINLSFHFCSILLFYFLMNRLSIHQPYQKSFSFIATVFFMFAPGLLWYTGNGYVNNEIMLSLLLAAIYILTGIVTQQTFSIHLQSLLLGCFILLLVYFDWFILFAIASFSIVLIIFEGWTKKNAQLLLYVNFAALSGIAVILLQYISYTGWKDSFAVLLQRFQQRAVGSKDIHLLEMLFRFAQHFITMYLPVLLVIAYSWMEPSSVPKMRIPLKYYLWVLCFAVLGYNILFAEWTAVHEFSLVPAALVLVPFAAYSICSLSISKQWGIMALFIIAAICQYYYINRPGLVARDGLPYNRFEKFGNFIKTIPEENFVFMNEEWTGEITYYAGKLVMPVKSIDSARIKTKEWNLKKAVWIEHENYLPKQIIYIK